MTERVYIWKWVEPVSDLCLTGGGLVVVCEDGAIEETIRGFKMIVDGECDKLPEQAFYMVGTIDEAFEKAKTIK